MIRAETRVIPTLSNLAIYPLNFAKKSYNKCASIIKDSYPYASFYHVKNRLSPCAEVKRLRQMAASENILDLDLIIQAICADNFAKTCPEIYKVLNKISDGQLNDVIKGVFAGQGLKNPGLVFKRLSSLLTLAKIESVVKSEFERFETEKTAKEIARPALLEADIKKFENRDSLIRLVRYYITSTLDWLVDTFLYVFMLKDISDGDANNLEKQMIAAMQWQAFRENLAFITAWLIALTVYAGSVATATALVAAIVLPILTIGLIYIKYFKPPPAHLHPADNLTAAAAGNTLPDVLFRKKIEDQVLTLLNINASTKNFRIYPLLIGKSGVGKSDIFKSIAKKINQGIITGPLKNLTCYSVNASMLVDGQGTPEHLELILKNIAGMEHKVLIEIAEVQGACETPERQVLRNLLLTSMDPGGLPFMVFNCTKHDYEKYIASDEAFMRRVQVIEVESLIEEQTYAVLAMEVAENFSDILISSEVLSYLSKITDDPDFADRPQPNTSKRILYKAIAQLRMNECSQEKNRLAEEADRNILSISESKIGDVPLSYTQPLRSGNEAEGNSNSNSNNLNVETPIQQFEKAMAKLNDFKDLLKERRALKNQIDSIALKIDGGRANDKNRKEFIMMLNYLKPALDRKIQDAKAGLGDSCPEITLESIRRIIEDERTSMNKVKNAAKIEAVENE